MAGENEAVTLLRYRTDTSSVQAAIQANKQVEASLKGVGAAASSSALRFDTIEQAQAALGIRIDQVASSEATVTAQKTQQLVLTQRLIEAEKARANAVEETAIAELRAGALGQTGGDVGGGGGIGRGISRASRGLFNLPDVQLGGGISTTVISRLGLVAGGAATSLGLTATALTGIVGVGALAAAAIGSIVSAENERVAAAKKNADQLRSLSERVAGGATSQDVQQRNRELEQQRNVLTQAQDQIRQYQLNIAEVNRGYEQGRFDSDAYRGALTALNAGLNEATAGALGFKDGVGQEIGAAGDLNAALAANQENINAVTAELAVNNIALNSQELAANDAAAAEEALREVRRQAVEEIFQGQSTFADSFVRGQGLTTEAREREIANLENQKASYEELIATGTLSQDVVSALNDKIDGLDNQIVGLTDASSEYADALARQESLERQRTETNDQYLALLDQESTAREKALDIQAKIADLQTDATDKLQDLAVDRADRLQEIEATSGERLAEIAEDNADKRERIERDFGRSQLDAVRTRNVVASIRAREKAADDLADLNKASEKQAVTVAKQLVKQEVALDKSYAKQVANVSESLRKQTAVQQRALAEQNFIVERSQASQAFLTANGMNNVVSTVAQGWNAVVNYTQQAFNNIFAAAAAQVSNTSIPVSYQTAPPLTGSAADRALNQRIARQVDTRLRQVWQD